MKTIVSGEICITRLLGKQRIEVDAKYRWMKYLLRSNCKEGILLHNVITGHLVLLNASEQVLLENDCIVPNDISMELIQHFFLVPMDYNEQDTVIKLRQIFKRIFMPKGINTCVIFTTTNCNARCYYCFESNYKRINMSAGTEAQIIEYLVCNKGDGPLSIEWFGGEPLIGEKQIDTICDGLRQHHVEYSSNMVSNGLLFTQEIIDKAVNDWNLKLVQITLDGTENVYNNTKRYVDAHGNPYRQVIENIHMLLNKGIFVHIRLNLDQNNSEDLVSLINELEKEFSGPIKPLIYVGVIIKNTGSGPFNRDEAAETKLYQKRNELTYDLEKRGFLNPFKSLAKLRMFGCLADDDSKIAIYPNGYLYKCEHVIEEDYLGHVNSTWRDSTIIEEYCKILDREECYDCPLFPYCLMLRKCPATESCNKTMCQYRVKRCTEALLYHYDKNQKVENSEKDSFSVAIERDFMDC